jgi:hypothetical protein
MHGNRSKSSRSSAHTSVDVRRREDLSRPRTRWNQSASTRPSPIKGIKGEGCRSQRILFHRPGYTGLDAGFSLTQRKSFQ